VNDFKTQSFVNDFKTQSFVNDFKTQSFVNDFKTQSFVNDFKTQHTGEGVSVVMRAHVTTSVAMGTGGYCDYGGDWFASDVEAQL
jgi:hypothetical protein